MSSGPIVLALDLFIKRGTYYTPQGMQQLFLSVAWITMCGLLAACAMVMLNLRVLQPEGMMPQRVELGKMLSSRGGTGLLGHMAQKVRRCVQSSCFTLHPVPAACAGSGA